MNWDRLTQPSKLHYIFSILERFLFVTVFIFNLIDIRRPSSLRSKTDTVDNPSVVPLKQQPASSAEY